MATKTGRTYGISRSISNGMATHSLYKAADVYTTSTTTHDGTFGYWYNVTSRGGVYQEANDSAYVDFDISSMPNVLTAKIVFNKVSAEHYVNARYISITNQYYKVEESTLGLNLTSTSFSTGEQSIDLTAQQIQQLNAINTVTLKISGYNSGNKSSSATGWFMSGRDDSVINTITGLNRYGSAYVSVEISNQSEANYIEYTYEELECTTPTITGDNVDNNIVVSWQCANQGTYTINVKNVNNVIVATFNGTTAQAHTITGGTIKDKGIYTFELVVTGNSQMAIKQVENVTLTRIEPIITSLEPNNIPQNKENDIAIAWANENTDQFTLNVRQSNVLIKTYTGTTQKQVTLPSNSLTTGTCNLELICKRLTNNTTTTKTATFEVYGKPNIPVFDQNTLYNTSLPTFTWEYTGTEQVTYNLEVRTLQNILVEEVTQINNNKSYKVINNLSNNTDYIVKLRIKNSWNLWSDYATKTIHIQFTELSKPNINVYLDGSNAIVEMTCPDVTIFDYNSVYRKADKTDWIRISRGLKAIDSITDYTIADGVKYYYKVRSVGTGGEMAESDIVTAIPSVNNYVLTDVTDIKNQLIVNCNPRSNFAKARNISYSVFAGCSKPTVEVGIDNYYQGKLSFFIEKNEYDMCMNMLSKNTVISLRDYMGKQIFCFVVGDISADYEEYIKAYTISFDIVEVDFDITDMLFSNGLKPSIKLIYLDGKYKLDGSINLSGVIQ